MLARLRGLTENRWVRVAAVLLALVVPALTLPSLPHVTLWPLLVGLLPWMVGKYVLCPLRWHAISESGQTRRWHLRAYAESELLGLLTPGHVGADAWRTKRLAGVGMHVPSAVAEVGLDRLIGAFGLALFVGVAGAALPVGILLAAVGLAAGAVVVGLVIHRVRPELLPRRELPKPRHVAHGIVLSLGYQLTIGALLFATVAATGHELSPLALLGAFGASQIAGVVPGPNGASPRDGALVMALMGLGLPWQAALGAVTLMTSVAWLPALLLGGASLLLARRARTGLAPAPA
ncbi:MAG TPA: lysylphosphatidylglycerol synthase domain-containing protein [Mycobacteriales bacterium]|nr:lysylphosphatidylglycerol synthase domain-containing protein [Mycobacteriales bacterium]